MGVSGSEREGRRQILLQLPFYFPMCFFAAWTKHEKHDVALKLQTHPPFSLFFSTSPIFLLRLLCIAATAWSRPLSHSAVTSPAVFTLYFLFSSLPRRTDGVQSRNFCIFFFSRSHNSTPLPHICSNDFARRRFRPRLSIILTLSFAAQPRRGAFCPLFSARPCSRR